MAKKTGDAMYTPISVELIKNAYPPKWTSATTFEELDF